MPEFRINRRWTETKDVDGKKVTREWVNYTPMEKPDSDISEPLDRLERCHPSWADIKRALDQGKAD